jgi:hypothetical protein
MAPRVGLEPQTLRLTAEQLVAASRCKHGGLRVQKPDFFVNWGGLWGYSREIAPKRYAHLPEPYRIREGDFLERAVAL